MMVSQIVTVQLPQTLYERVKQRAEQRQRSVEDELVAIVAESLPTMEELPADIAGDLAQLTFLTDNELRQAAQTTLSADQSERMQALLTKRQAEGLSPQEEDEAGRLAHLYDRTMLIRAQAAVLLKERGYDISNLGRSISENE